MKTLIIILAFIPKYGIAQTKDIQKSAVEEKFLIDSAYTYNISETDSFLESKSYCYYNISGDLTSDISFDFDQGGDTIWGSPKKEYTYNTKGLISEIIKYGWDKTDKKWLNVSKNEYNYDLNNNEILNIYFLWEGQFSESAKYESSYDTNGRKTSMIRYVILWNGDTGQWIKDFKFDYSYDSNGRQTLETDYSWDMDSSDWIAKYKNEITYNTNEGKTIYTGFVWDTISMTWSENSKSEYFFNGSNNIITEIMSNWDKVTNNWINNIKFEYIYDMNGNENLFIMSYWNKSANQWQLDSKAYSYYSLHNITKSSIIQIPDIVKLYPNPVKDVINLEINSMSAATCRLYNSNGQLIKVINVRQGLNTVNVNDLQTGIYFIQIQTRLGMVARKITKE
jgi:hypothetical protein